MIKYLSKFILVLFLFSGCKSVRELHGLFYSDSDYNLIEAKIILSKDSTFKYSFRGGLIDQITEGSWSLVNKEQIELNSFFKFKYGIVSVIQENRVIDGLEIELVDESNNPLSYANIIFNNNINDLGYASDINGIVRLNDKISIQDIEIQYLSESYGKQIEIDSNANFIKVITKLKDNSYIYFKNKKLKVKKNKLIGDIIYRRQ